MGGTSRFRGYNQGGKGQADHLQPQEETQIWGRGGAHSTRPSRAVTGSAELSLPDPRLAFGEVVTHQCINHSSNKCSLRFSSKKKLKKLKDLQKPHTVQ